MTEQMWRRRPPRAISVEQRPHTSIQHFSLVAGLPPARRLALQSPVRVRGTAGGTVVAEALQYRSAPVLCDASCLLTGGLGNTEFAAPFLDG